jgi:thiol-disulfide isomerase/thioredoxin
MNKYFQFFIFLTFIGCITHVKGQDSLFVSMADRMNKHVNGKVPDETFYDTLGNPVKLSSFAGKLIYLDFWETICAPCIVLFPYEEQLKINLQKLHLDTNIVFIKICLIDGDEEQYKSLIKEKHSTAINLMYRGDYDSLLKKFGFHACPSYQLINKNFTYLGTNVLRPDEGNILYLFFRGLQNVDCTTAFKEVYFFNNKFNKNNLDKTIPQWYLDWREKWIPVAVENNQWRKEQEK